MNIKRNTFKFVGPLFLLCGIVLIITLLGFYPISTNIISAWVVYSALSISQIFPLIALGFCFSLYKFSHVIVLGFIFSLSFFLALNIYDKVWILFTTPTSNFTHLYLTLPISSLCIGIALIVPFKIQRVLIYFVTSIVGFMIGMTTKLTDPTLHNPLILSLGFLISIWIIISIMFIVRHFYKAWFLIAFRIFGSWLITSGLLYGGSAIFIKPEKKVNNINTKKTKDNKLDENLLIPDFN